MLKKLTTALAIMMITAFSMPDVAMARDANLKPIQTEYQTVRFEKGVPTIEGDMANSAVKLVPLPQMDHGSYQFMIAVYNKETGAVGNFGAENIRVTRADGSLVQVFSRQDLEKKAKNRAMWSQIGMAVLAGAAAAAQNNNTTINTYTPRGTYTTVIHRPGLSGGQIAAIGAGGAGIALSQMRLQQTLDQLGDEIIQTTTVDPDASYGGRIIIGKLKKQAKRELLTVDVEFNGENHIFQFEATK